MVNLTAESVKILGPGDGPGKLVRSRWKVMKSTAAIENVNLGGKKMRKGRETNMAGSWKEGAKVNRKS